MSCTKRHVYKKIDFLRPYRESILCFKVNIQGINAQIFTLQLKLTTDLFTKTKQVFEIYKLLEGMKLIFIHRILGGCILRDFSFFKATFFLHKFIEISQKLARVLT